MSVKSPSHIVVALPEGTSPSYDMNEVLIRKFLKACKKENIQETVFEKSLMVKRFEKKSYIDRCERARNKRRALKEYNDANKAEIDDKNTKRKVKRLNSRENNDG